MFHKTVPFYFCAIFVRYYQFCRFVHAFSLYAVGLRVCWFAAIRGEHERGRVLGGAAVIGVRRSTGTVQAACCTVTRRRCRQRLGRHRDH